MTDHRDFSEVRSRASNIAEERGPRPQHHARHHDAGPVHFNDNIESINPRTPGRPYRDDGLPTFSAYPHEDTMPGGAHSIGLGVGADSFDEREFHYPFRWGTNETEGVDGGRRPGSRAGSITGSLRGSIRGSQRPSRRGTPTPGHGWPAYVDSDDEGIHVRPARSPKVGTPRVRSRTESYSPSRARSRAHSYEPPIDRSRHWYGGETGRKPRRPRRSKGVEEYMGGVSRHSGSESGSETNISDDAYSFTLTRHKRVNSTMDTNISDQLSDADGKIDGDDKNAGPPSDVGLEKKSTNRNPNKKPPKIINILNSKYTGEGSIGGTQTAKITILSNPPQTPGTKKHRQPLFRWVHFEDEAMNFDDFQSGVNNIVAITDLERQAISRLLTRARKRFDKPFQTTTGMKARYFIPCLLSESIASQTQIKGGKPRVVTWIVQSHFQMRKYKALGPTDAKPSDHPTRTLMQARFALVQKERDMQQAVCQLKDAKPEWCFHIVQTWYLILDDSLLITCSGLRMQDLEGDMVKVLHEPSMALHGNPPPCVTVQCGRCLLWSFRIDECQSWFDFVCHFAEYWPRVISFRHNGKMVNGASDWPKIVNLAMKANVRLTLEHKAPSREKFEAPDDFPPIQYDSKTDGGKKDKEKKGGFGKSPRPGAVDQSGFVAKEYGPGGNPVQLKDQKGTVGGSYSIPPNSKPESRDSAAGYFDKPKRTPTIKPIKRQDSLAPPEPGISRTSTGSVMKPINLAEGFYVFTWLNAHPTSMQSPPVQTPAAFSPLQRSNSRNRSPSSVGVDWTPPVRAEMIWAVDEEDIRSDLKEVDDFLNSKSTVSDCVMYRETPLVSRQEVFDCLIRKKQKLLDATEKNDQEKLKVMENKATILAAADQVFQFFLPAKFEGPTVEKFWGAIYQLLFVSTLHCKWDDERGHGHSPVPGYGANEELQPNQANYPSRFNDEDRSTYYSHRDLGRKRSYGVRDREVPGIIDFLGSVVKQCQPFKELFSQAHSTDRLNLQLPEEFAKAWLYILICMAACTKDIMVFDTEINQVYDLMAKGMRKVVEGNAKKSLLESLVFTPFELAVLINFQLDEGTNKFSEDIIEPYWQYLRSLEADIASNPLDRGHQDRIALFQQELDVASETLEQQKHLLLLASPSSNSKNTLPSGRPIGPLAVPYNDDHYGAGPIRSRPPQYRSGYEYDDGVGASKEKAIKVDYIQQHAIESYDVPVIVPNAPGNPSSQLQPTHPSGVLGILIYDSLNLVDHKMRDLKEMNEWLEHLSNSSLQKIDTNKDRQEAAIFAFTIVTIIFLPLSTVASIMGMNTADIRDMKHDQWLFWATSVPLFLIIVVLCLLWAGELDSFWQGTLRIFRMGNRVRKGAVGRVGRVVSRNRQYPGDVGLPMGPVGASVAMAPGMVTGINPAIMNQMGNHAGHVNMQNMMQNPQLRGIYIKSDMRMPDAYQTGVYSQPKVEPLRRRGSEMGVPNGYQYTSGGRGLYG